MEACIFLVHTDRSQHMYYYESSQCSFIHKKFNGKLLIKENKLEKFYFRLDDMGSAEKVWEFLYDQDIFLLLQSAKWALQCCVYYKGLWHRHARLTCFEKLCVKSADIWLVSLRVTHWIFRLLSLTHDQHSDHNPSVPISAFRSEWDPHAIKLNKKYQSRVNLSRWNVTSWCN